MRKVCFFVLLVSLFFTFVGCKAGIQVQDNTYDALGGQVISVSKDFQYVGQCDPTVMVNLERERSKANAGVTTRGDVFVKAVNGQPSEIFIVQRTMFIKGGWYWGPAQGTPVNFHGKSYKENFFDAKETGEATVQSYMDFLNQNGFKVDVPDLYVLDMTRNIGKQTLATLFYGVYPGLIPETQRGDVLKEKQFIRDQFDENVTVID